ncbi:MAG: prenyltransferase/squalene oxidase repeat-containing protein, partial [Pirellulaceae bacterium]
MADAVKWRAEHECATCHHGALSVWAFSEARSRGFALDAAAVADIADWTKTRFFEKLDAPRAEGSGASLVSQANIYLALSAQFVSDQDAIGPADLDRIAGHLVRHQEADGSWSWSSAPRKNTPPPVFESDETVTLMAYLALQPRAPADPETTAPMEESRRRAAEWLAKTTPTGTTQALAFRLLIEARTAQTGEPLEAALEALRGRQNDDGGWGQVADAPSDAYGTGQALYALSLAGVPSDSAEVQRGIAFLISNQRDDGSWPMVSRAHPGEQPFTNPV